MCLIGLSHRAIPDHPLVIAANRDEDYDRPTLPADFWSDAPEILGGRDALHGGTWLAISKSGRFAAVTNLRGATREPHHRSRGELVRGFVTGKESPRDYAQSIDPQQYSGFHLIAGEIGGDVVLLSGEAALLSSGIYAISNAPAGEHWQKETTAIEAMRTTDADELLAFLRTSSGEVESSAFIAGERYGTRCSTVVVATNDRVLFVEQSYARGGVAGERRDFSYSLALPRPGVSSV